MLERTTVCQNRSLRTGRRQPPHYNWIAAANPVCPNSWRLRPIFADTLWRDSGGMAEPPAG
jgi:hypothetical protein